MLLYVGYTQFHLSCKPFLWKSCCSSGFERLGKLGIHFEFWWCILQCNDVMVMCLCYCVTWGHETKAMMNNSGPRYKRSRLEKRLNTDILWCVVLLIVMCLIAAIGGNSTDTTHTALTSPHNSLVVSEWPPAPVSWCLSGHGLWLKNLRDPVFQISGETNPALAGFYVFWTMIIVLQVSF